MTRSTLERTHPRLATGPAAQRLLTLINRLGAVSLDTAVHIAYLADRRPLSASYRAGQALVRARLVTSVPIAAIGLGRAPGLGRILVPGAEWPQRASEFGLIDNPCVTDHDRAHTVAEHLVLGAELTRRLLDGWQFLTDDAWLAVAANTVILGRPSDRLRLAQRALSSGILHTPPDVTLTGLVPPDNIKRPPALLLSDTVMPTRVRQQCLRMLDHVAPIELVIWNKSNHYTHYIRRLLARSSELTVLPRGRGLRWRSFWGELYRTVRRVDAAARIRASSVLTRTHTVPVSIDATH